MNFDYNKKLESENFVDGIIFTRNDPCIWNVYPPGAAGDLLSSIINVHYGRTASQYLGINDRGQVIFRPSDMKITNIKSQSNQTLFDDQYFFDLASAMAERHMNYSLCDQFIFSCHLHQDQDIRMILETFAKAKIIRTYFTDSHGKELANYMAKWKNDQNWIEPCLGINQKSDIKTIQHPNVLNVPFGAIFVQQSYYEWYDQIIEFLGLNGRLICYDYIKYYISKQHPKIKNMLLEYGQRA